MGLVATTGLPVGVPVCSVIIPRSIRSGCADGGRAPAISKNEMVSHAWPSRRVSFQELSKITMPVIFNEPLSFLQRLAEYMEHTFLLHQANACSDSVERMKVEKQPANDGETLQKTPQHHMWGVCYFSVCSAWLPLQCQLWPPSGSVQVNPSTHYWEKPTNWSGECPCALVTGLLP